MAYHSKHSNIWHKYEKCTVGNNIERNNRVEGKGIGTKYCENCKDIDRGKKKR